MSCVVLIISIPSEEHENQLLKKIKKKTVSKENCTLQVENGTHHEPSDRVDLLPMEQIVRTLTKELEIVDITWMKTEDGNHYQIVLPIECGNKCEEILEILKENGIGTRLNSKISVMPCTIQYHGNEVNENEETIEDQDYINYNYKKTSGWNLFISSVRARLTVAQVVENVKAKAEITFDFLMLLLISTILCALSLVENNSICMLSSMLISPMMGPVMAGTFGSVIGDKHLQKIGVRNELIGLGVATLVGFVYGTIVCLCTDKYGNTDWPTYEMYSRGEFRSLWVGAIIALLSGAAVALGILSDNIASLVGVAISVSLMPPAVNAGLLWSLGFVYYLKNDELARYSSITRTDYFSMNSTVELSALGAVSLCLTFVNIVCIYLAGILVFMIKEVAPHTTRDQMRRRFWKHDIKVTRNYNKTIRLDETRQNMFKHSTAWPQNHFSTDLSKETLRPQVKTLGLTWSPNLEHHATLLKPPSGGNRRRLSQIFSPIVRKEDEPNEGTALLSNHHPRSGTFLLASGKIITVTPCDTP